MSQENSLLTQSQTAVSRQETRKKAIRRERLDTVGVDGGRGRSTHLPLGTRPAVTEDAGGQPPGPPRALQRLPPLPPSPLLESQSRRPARAVPRGALGTFDDALGRGDLRAPPGHGLLPAPAARTTRAAAFLPSGLRSAGRQPPCRAPEDGASSDGGGRSAAPSLRRRPRLGGDDRVESDGDRV